jgi:hypothetical protein
MITDNQPCTESRLLKNSECCRAFLLLAREDCNVYRNVKRRGAEEMPVNAGRLAAMAEKLRDKVSFF